MSIYSYDYPCTILNLSLASRFNWVFGSHHHIRDRSLVTDTPFVFHKSGICVRGELPVTIVFFRIGLARDVAFGVSVYGALGLGVRLQISIPGWILRSPKVRHDDRELAGFVLDSDEKAWNGPWLSTLFAARRNDDDGQTRQNILKVVTRKCLRHCRYYRRRTITLRLGVSFPKG